MKIKILQWNVNGFHTRYEFLQKILKDDNYDILCIQETNFKNKYHFNIKGYQCFYKNRLVCANASGGVAIYVHNSIKCSECAITSDLEVCVIQLYIGGSSFHLCNAYIPNAFQLEYHHLDKLYSQISGAVLIVGDFNSHNLIWGSGRTDRRGKIVGDFVNNEDLMVLNDCRKSTYFNVGSGNST